MISHKRTYYTWNSNGIYTLPARRVRKLWLFVMVAVVGKLDVLILGFFALFVLTLSLLRQIFSSLARLVSVMDFLFSIADDRRVFTIFFSFTGLFIAMNIKCVLIDVTFSSQMWKSRIVLSIIVWVFRQPIGLCSFFLKKLILICVQMQKNGILWIFSSRWIETKNYRSCWWFYSMLWLI